MPEPVSLTHEHLNKIVLCPACGWHGLVNTIMPSGVIVHHQFPFNTFCQFNDTIQFVEQVHNMPGNHPDAMVLVPVETP